MSGEDPNGKGPGWKPGEVGDPSHAGSSPALSATPQEQLRELRSKKFWTQEDFDDAFILLMRGARWE